MYYELFKFRTPVQDKLLSLAFDSTECQSQLKKTHTLTIDCICNIVGFNLVSRETRAI